MSLSDKINITKDDIKEFIKQLKEYAFEKKMAGMIVLIDELAGDELIKSLEEEK